VTAAYPTIESLVEALADPASDVPFRAKLEPTVDYLQRAIEVVRVRTDVPVPALSPALPRAVADPGALVALVDRWGLDRPVNRLLNVLGVTP
jgi:hypothetical protein